MLPSRGLRILRNGRCNLGPDVKRQFSSTIINSKTRVPSILSNPSLSFSKSNLRPIIPAITAPVILNGTLLARFASTQPTPSPTPPPPTANPPEPTHPSDFDLRSTFEGFEFDPQRVEEGIGYLKSLGIDYGWGPSSCMQWLLEHVHVYAGTPWFISIALSAVVLRLIMLRVYVEASNNGARMAAVKHISAPLTTAMNQAFKDNNQQQLMGLRQQIIQLNKKAEVKVWKSGLPLIQIPIGYGFFRVLRGCADAPVPNWEIGGLPGWFPDLTASDPYYIMPVGIAAMTYVIMKRGGDTGIESQSNPLMSPQTMKYLQWGAPAITFVFMFSQPAGVQVYFLVGALWSLIQTMLFASPWFRNILGMDPLPQPVTAAPVPPQDTGMGPAERRVINISPPPHQKRIVTLGDVRRAREQKGVWQAPRQAGSGSQASTMSQRKSGNGGEAVQGSVTKTLKTMRTGAKTIGQSVWPGAINAEDFEKEDQKESKSSHLRTGRSSSGRKK